MAKVKVSLITTVLNEEGSIESFFESVRRQTKMPDEIIIVDGGSTDSTVDKVKSLKLTHSTSSGLAVQSYSSKFKIIKNRGNRSVGRNEAIKHASGEIIAASDVGCILDRNWLKNIIEPFENKKIDVTAGFYRPKTSSIFEKCLATYTCTMLDKVNPNKFLPSSRSVAFRKKVWKQVGGYPEGLDTCEDLVFDKKLKKARFKFTFAKHAIVFWPQRKNIIEAARQFLSYAIGDGEALYIRPQTPLLFTRYLFGLLIFISYLITKSNYLLFIIYYLLFIYIVWAVWKNYKYVKHPKAILYLPILQIVSDAAVLLGMTVGLLKRFLRLI